MPCFLSREKIQLPRKWGRNSDGKRLRKGGRKEGKKKEKKEYWREKIKGRKGLQKTEKKKKTIVYSKDLWGNPKTRGFPGPDWTETSSGLGHVFENIFGSGIKISVRPGSRYFIPEYQIFFPD